MQRISELERQLQQEREKVENLSSLQDRKNKIDETDQLKNMELIELTLEQERLHIELSEKVLFFN